MKYVCKICGHVYDEAKEKIPFADLPADWKCPLCGAAKGDFEAEQEKPQGDPFRPIREDAHLKELSAGQLSALCSNLARGCEKQYKAEEATLFRELAAYFAAVTPPVEDACVEGLAARLLKDVDDYADVRATADANGDRGAARVCVWGEKVTRMLSSLVDRYLKEGEAMLANAQVWVCTVCGFVYVGEECPEICPVCRVPAWKFEKIEGRTKK